MSVAIVERSALRLLEAPGGDGIFNPDGTVTAVIIRPCDGRGPGARKYGAAMLARDAPTFSGLPSYLNHLDPRAQKAAGKLRRGPEELAGELRECYWDPTYTAPDDAQFGYERGAVVGKFMPASDLVESLLRRIPSQLKFSINSQATGLRPIRRKDGSKGWLVEGMANDPENCSVDLVTAAGAGGRVAALLESAEITNARRREMSTAVATGSCMGSVTEWLARQRRRDLTPRIPSPDGEQRRELLESVAARAARSRSGSTEPVAMASVSDYIARYLDARSRRV